jgi:hypothetical protein
MIDLKKKMPDGAKPSNRAAEMAEEAQRKEGEAPAAPLAETLLGDNDSGGRAGQGGMGGPAA